MSRNGQASFGSGGRGYLWAGAAAGVLLGLAVLAQALRDPPPPSPLKPFAPPALLDPPSFPPSPYRNANGEAAYIGTAACAKCHPDEFDSYRRTAHSASLAPVSVDAEPPDGAFRHPASRRRYEVFRRDGQLVHRERLDRGADLTTSGAGDVLPVVEHAVPWLVGSGHHTRSYLIDDGGFLAESPVTWFVSRGRWDMSPGYDQPGHLGFERQTDVTCLFCHLGRAENVAPPSARMRILEPAIGCERCHGPGSLHAALHDGAGPTLQKPDDASHADSEAIVHPGRLPRDLREAICADCHLRAEATVLLRGRSLTDFRPGRPLEQFRIDYRLKTAGGRMTVVGHVEQMRLSRCYQASGTLTCTTCHNPHADLDGEARVAFYRERCLSCHEQSCGLEAAERRRRRPDDHCAACHMPSSETNIQHVAFTHHRIGLHAEKGTAGDSHAAAPAPGRSLPPGELVPFALPADLPQGDRDRSLGLAYLELAGRRGGSELAADDVRRAEELLRSAIEHGAGDGDVLAALARLAWERDDVEALLFAGRALESPSISDSALATALLVQGEMRLRMGKLEAARPALERLVTLRRHAEDWFLLGQLQARQGDFVQARRSLERSVSINPFRAEVQLMLADVCRELADESAAARHREAARQISERRSSSD